MNHFSESEKRNSSENQNIVGSDFLYSDLLIIGAPLDIVFLDDDSFELIVNETNTYAK